MTIGAAEKERAEGSILEHGKWNEILNRVTIFISSFCTNLHTEYSPLTFFLALRLL